MAIAIDGCALLWVRAASYNLGHRCNFSTVAYAAPGAGAHPRSLMVWSGKTEDPDADQRQEHEEWACLQPAK